MLKIVITGGHHNSALPVIELLLQRYNTSQSQDLQIHWFGHRTTIKGDTKDSLEYQEITQLNIPFYELKAGKLYKTFDIIRLLKVPFGLFHALYFLLKIKPDLIVSFGGYLAAPTVIAGKILGVPSITHEQTVVAGYANKLIAHFADKILLSWPQSRIYFPGEKTVVTGLPLRNEITQLSSQSFISPNNLPTIYITAGKTGSHVINLTVKAALPELLKFANIIHQCGDNSIFDDFSDANKNYEAFKDQVPGVYYPKKYVFADEIGEAYNRSTLVIARSGAHTTAELLFLEKPCVLVPIPWVSHNEQFENANILKNAGLAEILEEKNLSAEALISSVKKIIQNPSKYIMVSDFNKEFLEQNASQNIVEEIASQLSKSSQVN